ncbi:MAG TPA: AAA family ATPase [Candidatus Binatia bacterium]|nr:AAA family ATPase [Candidatus Binatia bacterium]
MPRYFHHFGLDRDPFLDTADPHFYLETPMAHAHKRRLLTSIDESRGLTIVVGETGAGKTSLSALVEHDLLSNDRWIIGKILDPTFATDVEFLLAIGRVFGLSLPPRSSAALKNALKNFFFDTAVLESKTLVLIIDEAQNLNGDGLETLRLLLNFQIPQKKLLNVLLFGQPELERAVATRGNLADRVDGWIRLGPLDAAAARAIVEYRLTQAGQTPGSKLFSDEAMEGLIAAAGGYPRRLTTLAHTAMFEAAERGSQMIFEEHVAAALRAHGLPTPPKAEPVAPAMASGPAQGTNGAHRRSLFERLFGAR